MGRRRPTYTLERYRGRVGLELSTKKKVNRMNRITKRDMKLMY